MDHHCLERAAIRVKMNILHAQTRACTRTLKMNFSLDAVHEQGTPRACMMFVPDTFSTCTPCWFPVNTLAYTRA